VCKGRYPLQRPVLSGDERPPDPRHGGRHSSAERLASNLVNPSCSFCGGVPPVAWYEGPDFVKSVPSADEVRSEEAWLACAVCVGLVNEGDREALVLRSAQDTLKSIRDNFDHLFWALRDRALGGTG
jgi:hypothetical protein